MISKLFIFYKLYIALFILIIISAIFLSFPLSGRALFIIGFPIIFGPTIFLGIGSLYNFFHKPGKSRIDDFKKTIIEIFSTLAPTYLFFTLLKFLQLVTSAGNTGLAMIVAGLFPFLLLSIPVSTILIFKRIEKHFKERSDRSSKYLYRNLVLVYLIPLMLILYRIFW